MQILLAVASHLSGTRITQQGPDPSHLFTLSFLQRYPMDCWG